MVDMYFRDLPARLTFCFPLRHPGLIPAVGESHQLQLHEDPHRLVAQDPNSVLPSFFSNHQCRSLPVQSFPTFSEPRTAPDASPLASVKISPSPQNREESENSPFPKTEGSQNLTNSLSHPPNKYSQKTKFKDKYWGIKRELKQVPTHIKKYFFCSLFVVPLYRVWGVTVVRAFTR